MLLTNLNLRAKPNHNKHSGVSIDHSKYGRKLSSGLGRNNDANDS